MDKEAKRDGLEGVQVQGVVVLDSSVVKRPETQKTISKLKEMPVEETDWAVGVNWGALVEG